jgi:hypothetical protein
LEALTGCGLLAFGRSRYTRAGLRAVGLVWLVGLSSCAGASQGACGAGRTLLDGVCVSENVADYVGCVRAQGASLGTDQSRTLSAEAGYAGMKAGVASDVKDTLEKKYAVSDVATVEVIKTCSRMAEKASGVPGTPSTDDPCQCLSWQDVSFSMTVGNTTCHTAEECIAMYHLGNGECTKVTEDRLWCYTRSACASAKRSADGARYYRYCD